MLKEFKAFVLRGNVVDLAVGVVIGAAFVAVVNSLVKDVLTPLLGLVHVPDFSNAAVNLGTKVVHGKVVPRAMIRYGVFLNSLISLLFVSAAIFFFVVKPLNRLMGRDTTLPPAMRECPWCLSSIRAEARICPNCTKEVNADAG